MENINNKLIKDIKEWLKSADDYYADCGIMIDEDTIEGSAYNLLQRVLKELNN